jgi:uncharacterized protein YigA (DUF484 family)
MSLRFVAKQEARIQKLKEHIALLKQSKRSTQSAEAELRQLEQTLTTLRNHSEIMQELMKRSPRTKKP